MADMNEMKRKAKDMGADAKEKAKNVGAKAENLKDKTKNHMQEMRGGDETADTM